MKFLAPLLVCLAVSTPASAQLMLPGAVGAPPEAGMAGAPAQPAKPKPKPKPAAPKAASEDALVGQDLYLNGRNGLMSFARAGKELSIGKLKLAGDVISRPGERCEVDVVSGGQIALKGEGRPNGAARYGVELPACPFSVEVLSGAALALHVGGACEFTAADCRVEPAGLWGPTPNAFSPARIKEFERARGSAEVSMREGFKSLASGKDRTEIRKVAGEQAGFSAEREMICRDYAREDTHGFCALRITEARSISLRARLGKGVDVDAAASPKPKKKKKPKPAAPAAAPLSIGPGMGGTF